MDFFGIDPQQLMPAAEIAGLDRRRSASVRDEKRFEVREAGAERLQLLRRLIFTGQPDQRDFGAEGDQIGRDVAGSAQKRPRGAVFEDRNRRLGRDSRDPSLDETVEKNVADDQHACLCKAVDDSRALFAHVDP